MGQDQAFISFILTCKGRLDHLKETLPVLMGQPGAQVIVVDYDCPDGTAQWVREHHPECIVVQAFDKPLFHPSDARNMGMQAATGEWLFFLDADIILSPGIVARLRGTLSDQHYFVLQKFRTQGAYGSVLATHEAVRRIGGWDTHYVGYGGEDYDFFRRLSYIGLTMAVLRDEPERVIPHSPEMRTQFMATSRLQSLSTGKLYGTAKRDLMKIHRRVEFPEKTLTALRAASEQAVQQAIDEQRTTASVTIDLEPEIPLFAEEARRRPTIRRRLTVEIDLGM